LAKNEGRTFLSNFGTLGDKHVLVDNPVYFWNNIQKLK